MVTDRHRRPPLTRPQPRLAVLAVAACFAGASVALPNGPNVVSGQATFHAAGKALTVTNTPGAIINWNGFSIRADELARFQQQSGSSTVLNRVVGQDPSAILGALQSNGRVFIINPNGIVFGRGSQIDVAGLVASSLHLSNADFLSGRMQFREQGGASGSVVNQGEIRTPIGGQVYLVAPRVENHGLITTPGGDIVLAAGKKIEIVDAANPSVRIEVAAPENEALNVGKLVAAGGRIAMLGGALRVSGKVSADAAVVENGKVSFRRNTAPRTEDVAGTVHLQASDKLTVETGAIISADGPVAGTVTLQSGGDLELKVDSRVSASGAIGGAVAARAETGTLVAQGVVEATGSDGPGGTIRLQGNRVALLQRSRTDASGTAGGGTVLVGGGFQGNDPSMQNAQKTVVAPGAEIRADATVEGDGGTVVVWSDQSTRYYGGISAKGAGVGKGGFVEVSGKQYLDFAGGVDVSATSGRAGTLLLDPLNITLTTADANTGGFTVPGDIQELFADDAGLTSTFNVNAGGSFSGIAAGSNIVLQATNNITAASAFNITAATGNTDVSLTLQANNSIAINAAITTSGNGSLTLIADNDQNGTGAISRTAAGTLTAGNGGTITLQAGTGLNAAVSAPSVTVSNANSGVVTVTNNAAGGSVAFGNVVASALSVTTANGAVTQTGTMNVSAGTATLVLGTAGDANLSNANNDFGTVAVTSGRNVQLADRNAIVLGASTVSGNLLLTTNNGSVTQSAALTVTGTANLQAGTGNITLATATNNFNVVEAAGQAVSLRDTNTMTLGNVAATGTLTLVSVGALNQTVGSTVSAVGNATFNAGAANNITLTNATNNFTTVQVVSGNNVQLTDVNGFNFGVGVSTVSGTLAVTANGAVAQAAALTVAGAATFNVGAGNNLTLTQAANNFTTLSVTSANNVTLVDVNTLALGNVTTAGNLTVTTAGLLNQTAGGSVIVGGTANFTAGAANNITLSNATNNFGVVRVVSGNNVQIRDVDGLSFGGGASTVSGALTVTANGAVTQASSLAVTGLATFNIGTTNDLTLGNTTNAFGNVSIVSAGNATLFEAGGFDLAATTVSNNLTVTSTGAITDSGNIVVPGRLTIETRNNAAQNITLDSAGNNFGSVSARTMNQTAATAVNGAITLREASAMDVALLTTGATGTGNLTAAGAITQSGVITVGGTLTANAGSANDITLNLPTNNFGTVAIVQARDATLVDVNAMNVGAGTVSRNLTVTANGAVGFSGVLSAGNLSLTTNNGSVTQSAALTVTGTANFQAGTANITLATATNNFNVVEASGQALSLRDTNAMTLGNVAATGTLTVVSVGALNQMAGGTVSAVGNATFNAGAATNNITLTNATNNFTTVQVVSGNNVQLTDVNGFNFGVGASTVSGALTVTANGAVAQTSSLTVTGVATFNIGTTNDLTLANTANNFATVAVTSANNVTLRDTNAITLGNVTVPGTLTVTTGGTQNQAAGTTMNVGGLVTFNAGANAITFNNAGNDFSTVRILAGGATTLRDANGLSFGGGASAVTGALTVTGNGALTQASSLSVTGLATFNIGTTNDLTLGNTTNAFGNVSIVSAGNATLFEAGGFDLAATTVSNNLTVTSTGAITDSGNIVVPGRLTIETRNAAATAITLDSVGNNFGSVSARAMNAAGNAASSGVITLREASAMDVALLTTTGNANLTAAGAITQSGVMTTGGTLMANAGSANDITLTQPTNNFGTVAVTSGRNVDLRDANAIVLGAMTLTGNLAVTTNNGAITQSGTLLVPGTANFQAGTANITLATATNNFNVVEASGQALSLRDTNAMTLGNVAATGTLTVVSVGALNQMAGGTVSAVGNATFNAGAATNNITLTNATNNFTTVQVVSGNNVQLTDVNGFNFGVGASTVSGALTVTANGAVAQTSSLTVTGVATFNIGTTNDLTLANTANNFATVAVTSANNVTLRDTNAITLGNVTVPGTLTVTTGGTQNQAAGTTMNVGGLVTFNAGANAITFNNAGNDFSTVRILAGGATTLRDANGLSFGGGASAVTGALTVTGNGALTQASSLAVTGLATFNIGTANDLTLGNTTNAFGNVSIVSAGNATLFEAGGFDLAATTVSNNLTVTSTGAITDSGNIVVPGRLTIETRNNAAQNITLDSAGNNFGSVSARTMNQTAATAVNGAITLREASAMDVALLTTGATGTGNLTAAGAITQSGVITVGGTLTANAGSANDITLNLPTNNFGTVAIVQARDATLVDVNAMNVGAGTVSRNLTVTANGAVGFSGVLSAGNLSLTTNNGSVTQSAALTVTGTANLQAGTGNITLATATNNFNVVEAAGQAVSLRDTNTMTLGNVAATGTLTLVSVGALNQTVGSTVSAVGNATFNAGAANNITLTNATNNFTTVQVVSGNNVQLTDVNGFNFGVGVSTVSGTLAVTANGAVAQAAALTVAGAATFNVGAGNNLTLTQAANNFTTLSVTSANNVTLVDVNTLALGNVTTAGNLTVTTAGLLNQTAGGSVIVGGTANFTAGAANNITLSNATNNFGVVRVVSGNNVQIRDVDGLSFGGGASTVSGALTVTANGAVTQASSLAVTGLATFNIGTTNDLTLGNVSNNFGTVAVVSAANTTIVDANAITLNASTVSGALNVTATNNTLTVAGNISTAAANGAISFNAGTGQYVQAANMDVASGSGNITISANAMNINTNTGNNAFQTSGMLTLRPGATTQNMTVGAVAAGFNLPAATFNSFLNGLNNLGGSLTIGRSDSTGVMTIGAAQDFGTGSRVTLAAGSITDGNTVRTLTADTLTLYANSGNIGAAGANNAIDVAVSNLVVGASNQSAFIRSAAGLNFGPATSNLGSGSLVATAAAGNITQSGAIIATGNATTFNAGTSSVTLGNASNDFGTVQVVASNASITDANAITLAAASLSGNLSVTANGAIAQSGNLTVTGAATFNSGAGNIALASATNNFGSVGLSGASANIATNGVLVLRASTLTGDLRAAANGAVSQAGAVTVAGTANFTANNSAVTLSNPLNDFGLLNMANVGNTTIRDQNALALAGANVNGTLSITTAGALTQTGAVVSTGTVTIDAGTGGNVTLTNAGNDFATVVVSSANNVSLVDSGAIDLGAFSVNGAITVSSVGNLGLSGVLQAAGAGNAIVLATGGNFLNNAGASALSTTSGRWLVYSADPALNTFGGLASGNGGLWSHTYAGNAPATISQSGNRYLFSTGRVLTVTGTNVTKTFGQDVTGTLPFAYTVSGLNTNTYGGAVLADTQAGVMSGAASITSAGAAASAPVAGSPYAMTLGAGSLSAANGYTFVIGGTGQLTVTPMLPSAFTIDPLQTAYNAMRAPGEVGLWASSSAAGQGPSFILAEADIPFEELLRSLPPTAAGPDSAKGGRRLLDPRCTSGLPLAALRCSRADE